jgi:uncharacterized membrane protein YheB (UPF0754 family)
MLSIPVFGGIIGYLINWTGVWMLYQPVEFKGLNVPGLQRIAHRLPKKLRQMPGVMNGGIGWQGIIPSRAAKMASIAVDKQISKIGSPGELFDQLQPERIAEHLLANSEQDVRELVERTMEREYGQLWSDLPPKAREALHARVKDELPGVVDEVTEQLGAHMDELLDVKLMVMRQLEDRRELSNRLFHEVGKKEFRFIIRFGFVFAFLCGIPVIALVEAVPHWWVLPAAEAVIGYATNWLGIWLIYEPVEPKQIGPFRMHGLFLRRQHEASEAYAEVIAEDVITLENIGEELMTGPSADRTRRIIEDALGPAIDRAAGAALPAVRAAVGSDEYDAIRDSAVAEAAEYTLAPLKDEEFGSEQNRAIRKLFTERMREMPAADFVEALRSATREDEWLLVAHGALFGIAGGLIHYVVFGL